MRARSTSALTAFAGAIVAAAVLGAPSSAQAAPEAAYPAPAPAIRVSSASITIGNAVRLSGRSFQPGEPISISVRYRITRHSGGFDNPFGVRINGDRRADENGKFSARIRLGTPGLAVIRVTGKKSHKTVRVTVRVLAWHNSWPDDIFAGTPLGSGGFGGFGGFDGDHRAGYFGPFSGGWSPFRLTGNETGLVVAAAAAKTEHRTYGADVVPALLGLTALLGSSFMLRRRRTS